VTLSRRTSFAEVVDVVPSATTTLFLRLARLYVSGGPWRAMFVPAFCHDWV